MEPETVGQYSNRAARKKESCNTEKPAKPYKDFPLYAHRSGRWAKKIRGQTRYFGPWRDPKGALERYKVEADYWQSGRLPPENTDGYSVGDLVNDFLEHRSGRVQSGELTQRSWNDYQQTGVRVIECLGRHTPVEILQPDDFAQLRSYLATGRNLVALGNEIARARAMFNFGVKNDLLSRPARMGVSFDKPSAAAVARQRDKLPAKVFTIHELRMLYQSASPIMRTFMLLALNGGLGNADIGRIEKRHVQHGWVDFPRPKTAVPRQFPLWPETRRAIEDTRSQRPGDLLFLTKYGEPWHKPGGSTDAPLSKEFRKLCLACNLHQCGRGFYSLRHQFRTVADGCRDKVAIDRIMGHADRTMAGLYREWIEPERIEAVVNHVRRWCRPIWRPRPG